MNNKNKSKPVSESIDEFTLDTYMDIHLEHEKLEHERNVTWVYGNMGETALNNKVYDGIVEAETTLNRVLEMSEALEMLGDDMEFLQFCDGHLKQIHVLADVLLEYFEKYHPDLAG